MSYNIGAHGQQAQSLNTMHDTVGHTNETIPKESSLQQNYHLLSTRCEQLDTNSTLEQPTTGSTATTILSNDGNTGNQYDSTTTTIAITTTQYNSNPAQSKIANAIPGQDSQHNKRGVEMEAEANTTQARDRTTTINLSTHGFLRLQAKANRLRNKARYAGREFCEECGKITRNRKACTECTKLLCDACFNPYGPCFICLSARDAREVDESEGDESSHMRVNKYKSYKAFKMSKRIRCRCSCRDCRFFCSRELGHFGDCLCFHHYEHHEGASA